MTTNATGLKLVSSPIDIDLYDADGAIHKAKSLAAQSMAAEARTDDFFIVWFSEHDKGWRAVVSTTLWKLSNSHEPPMFDVIYDKVRKVTSVGAYVQVRHRAFLD